MVYIKCIKCNLSKVSFIHFQSEDFIYKTQEKNKKYKYKKKPALVWEVPPIVGLNVISNWTRYAANYVQLIRCHPDRSITGRYSQAWEVINWKCSVIQWKQWRGMEHNVFIILLFVSPLIPKKNGHLKTKTLFLIYSVQFGQGEKQNLKLCKKCSNNFFLLQISDLHPPIYERPLKKSRSNDDRSECWSECLAVSVGVSSVQWV